MIVIDERHLSFEFDSKWDHVEQWDKTAAFKKGVSKVEGIRALDIIALSKERRECLLIEVKDFRDQNEGEDAKTTHKIKNKRGNSSSPTAGQTASALAEQIAQKVAGTLAGLVGAARMQDTKFAGDFTTHLAAHKSEGLKVRIVLWVEGRPTSKGKSVRAKANLQILKQSLKRKVAWLTNHSVQVLSTAVAASDGASIPGVTVTDNRP